MKCNQCGSNFEGKFCSNCGAQGSERSAATTQEKSNFQTNNMAPMKAKKPVYKKWWFYLIVIFVVIGIIGNMGGNDGDSSTSNTKGDVSSNNSTNKSDNTKSDTSSNNNINKSDSTKKSEKIKVTVTDFSTMSQEQIQSWAEANKVICKISEDYSDTVEAGSFISQSKNANEEISEGDTIKVIFSLGKKPSIEYLNALAKAKSYSDMMHMSKQAIYQQLTSEYGEKFPADAAQYAVDNLKADYNANALAKAENYSETMNMSKLGIYQQLISEHGEKFTTDEAQYAVDNLKADYNANALAKAKSYSEMMKMSKQAIYDQLISEYGEKFTAEEAQYAIDNLND
jgi:hypothetical protein